MASKRKRKLEKKASREVDPKMQARRDSFNDMLWKFGPPVIAIVPLNKSLKVIFTFDAGLSFKDFVNAPFATISLP